MRRNDRQMESFDEIVELVDSCDTLRVAFNDEGAPYIVPLSFGYDAEDGEFVFYVHGAKVGRRHDLAAKGGKVCVELDKCYDFVETKPNMLTCDYASFIGEGEIETLEGEDAVYGLTKICLHCGFDRMPCNEAVVRNTCTEKITVRSFTAKRRFKRG